MNLGQKSSLTSSILGVKNSVPSSSLGVKNQSTNMSTVNLNNNQISDGVIRNDSNGNNMQREPMLGVKLPSSKGYQNKSNLEKATKLRHNKGMHQYV